MSFIKRRLSLGPNCCILNVDGSISLFGVMWSHLSLFLCIFSVQGLLQFLGHEQPVLQLLTECSHPKNPLTLKQTARGLLKFVFFQIFVSKSHLGNDTLQILRCCVTLDGELSQMFSSPGITVLNPGSELFILALGGHHLFSHL